METVTQFLSRIAGNGIRLSVEDGRLNCHARKGALTSEIRSGILAHKTELLALLAKVQAEKAPARPSRFPLSAGQKGLYILQQLNPAMTAFNVPMALAIRGELDVRKLEQAWAHVLERFTILSARIVEEEGTLFHDLGCTPLLQQERVALRDDELVPFLRERGKQPFDLNRGPLTRLELFTRNEREHVLLLTVHHMIFDGVSVVSLLQSLFAYYQQLHEGERVTVARDLPGYHDFVAWEESMLASAEGESHAAYWQQQLAGNLPTLELFGDQPRGAAPAYEGATLIGPVPEALSRSIRDFAKAQNLRPAAIFLGAFQLLLHRYTNQDDIIVGMPAVVRPQHKFMLEVGYFMNMLPLRTRCGGSENLSELLRRVQRTMLDGVYHAGYPFELMLDKVQSKGGSKNPVFQVNYAFQNFVGDASFAPALEEVMQVEHVREIGPEGYSEFALEIFETADAFRVHVKYNPGLYGAESVERFLAHYNALLESMATSADLPLQEYSIVPAAEKQLLLAGFNDTRAEYPSEKCIHDFFAERVAADPDRIAASFGGELLTYQELHDQSRDLALILQSHGVQPDGIVGLCLERSLEMMVSIMGTVTAGGAYMPLDPDYPDDRLTYMIQDSNAPVVLTQAKFVDRVRSLVAEHTTLIVMDRDDLGAQASALRAQGIELRRDVQPHNLAYVIYTSGSTGRPKGVLNEHRALVNRIHWMQKEYQLAPADIVLQKTPYSFDVSVWEFFWPMMTGSAVVFAVPDGHKDVQYLESLIDERGVTTLHFVPSMLRAYLEGARGTCETVKRIFASGEALDKQSADGYRAKFPNAVLHNLYGPTEAAIDVTYYPCDTVEHPFVPIGKPIDNIQLYILGANNQLQPLGIPGELHIAGDGLARGYLNRPELTAEKFVENPFTPGTRMYRTGDLARWMDDGNIQYLGRIDTQVKIRGFRIELGEIEAGLNELPGILDAAVIAKEQDGSKQLVAFYRAADEIATDALRAHLGASLPEYMVPSAFVRIDAIPLSSNGKVDRRALASLDVTMVSTQAYVAPRNETERQLVAIWGEVLNLAPETIGVNDNFFELGGHSLRAAQLISKVRAEMGFEIPLRAFFEGATVASLGTAGVPPAAAAASRRRIGRRDAALAAGGDAGAPLSYAQERLWFLAELDPQSAGYNLPGALLVNGPLDVDRLERAFNRVIARHENLRTVFPSAGGRPYQQILDRLDFALERVEATEEEAGAIMHADATTPFDLANGPLLRGKVIRLAEERHILLLNMHHIISDAWSLGVLIKEVAAFTSGIELPELPIQYADYSVWQRNLLAEEGVLAEQLAYWQQKLAGAPESLDLPADFARPAVQSFAGTTHTFALDAELTAQLKRLADQHGGTLYMVLLAAYKALLHRYTSQTDICVGSPIANRQYGETEGLTGMFVNTLALRSEVSPGDTFGELLAKVKTTCLEAYEHQDAPFEKVIDSLRLQRNLAVSPLFQTMVILQNVDFGTVDARMQRYPLHSGISKFDLTFEFIEGNDGLAATVEYCAALYRPETIARMAGHFTALCRAIAAAPAAAIRTLDYLGADEKQTLLAGFNATQADYPTNKLLHQLFVEQVPERAEDVAVICGDARLTYEELYDASRRLALYLQSQGIGPDSLVGVCMERSLDMIVSMLGILQAGGAYVPLDPNHPEDRLAYMVRDSRAAIVLTQESLVAKLSAVIPEESRLVAVDRDRAVIARAIGELRQDVRPDHLAYVIYTSGSTGNPKGVAIEHHSPVTLVHWAQDVYSREELRGVLAATSICFDLSVYEIFLTLASGGTILLVQNALGLIDLANKDAVTLINTVPSAAEELVRLNAIPASVQTINLAGEPLPARLVDRLYETTSVKKVFDLYGPSEDTTYSTFTLRVQNGPQTIGRPIANTQVYIVDANDNIQPIGIPGELCIAGDGLCRGYLHRPELTEQKFVANPFQAGTRMYRTGDLARWMDDGTLQYLGRIDTQVKIRGFRIELGEIEARLNEIVKDAVVIATGQGAERQLVAFYCADDTVAYEEFRAHLTKTLPDYMVPAAFVQLEAIPLNPNGKVDRRALSRIDVTVAAADRELVASRNATERRLAAIWSEVLGLETVGIHDNFFELGGHSLLATQLVSKIRAEFGVDLPLKALFEENTIAQLAQRIDATAQSERPAIVPADRSQLERLPLSFAQERLWFLAELQPESAGYNVPGAVTIKGALDVDRLEAAFQTLIERHETLRTVFPSENGRASQRILDRLDFALERFETSEEEARAIVQQDATAPFDLANGPLLRAKVIRIAEDEHILLLNLHHIISDGWSVGVVIRELAALMQGAALPALPIQYADYALWQRQWLESGVLETQLAYWQQKLAGAPETLDLPTDFPRPAVQSFAGATRPFTLDADLTARLRGIAEAQGGTLYMVLLSALNALLHRYTGQTDLCIGSPIANRNHGETESLIGMFVNTLTMRTEVAPGDSFTTLLEKVRRTALEAYEHQDAPFEKVVEALRVQRNLATTPLFQVMFVLQNMDMGTPDATIAPYAVESGISKFDLTFAVTEAQDGLAGTIEYSTALYTPETIERMIGHFTALCRAIAEQPAAAIRALDFLGADEKQTLLADFNATQADYPSDKLLHQLFVERVSSHANETAVVCGDARLTYQELHERSHRLALYLQAEGIGPDALVGVCMERSLDMIVSMLGILQAGGAYVPLDPNHPEDRLAYMVRDSRAAIVLTQESLVGKLSAVIPEESRLVAVDRDRDVIARAIGELRQDVRPDHLAYVIYTSGSTGNPKGVAIEHHSPVTLVHWAQDVYSREELRGVLAATSICFDLSVYEIFLTLASGGTILLVQNALGLIDLANKDAVTLINTVPSAAEELVRLNAIPASVQTINLAGEPLPARLVDRLYETTSVKKVFDLYGPSEDTTYSTFTLRVKNGPQTIGRPIANTQVYIVDANDNIQPIGIPGELCIAGDGLCRGYLHRPELTEQKFVANPFHPGTRMYRTGDLARWMDDGTLQYLGRIDTQVKIRGFRIELGEIEARLNEIVKDAVVIATGQGAERQLVAFYCADETVAYEEFRTHLTKTLPDYMVPAAFVQLDAIPLNPNGKVDRRALSRIDVTVSAEGEYVAPRNETERRLAAIWCELLGLETAGIHDNFFELGGHSLLATQLISKIRTDLGVELPLKALFEENTIAQLAQRIDASAKSDVPAIVPIDRSQLERLPLSFAQERLWFLTELQPESAGYNVPGAVTIEGALDVDRLESAFNTLVERHETLRTVFPAENGQAQQRILDRVDFRLARIEATEEEARDIVQREATTPFDLAHGPLFRGTVIRLAEEKHILLLNMHHIISDGWSLGVLIRELAALMDGRELPALPIQYADYAVWQRQWLESGVLEEQLAYWRQQLAGAPETLDLPTDFARPAVQSFAGATLPFALGAELTGKLNRLAEERGSTLYMVLLSAFNALLHRYTGQTDLCVGSPIANRNFAETEGLIGMFVNTLTMRNAVGAGDTFDALLAKVKATALEAYDHQDAPFEKVVDALRVQRNLATTPLFQVMFILQNMDLGAADTSIRTYAVDSGISKFDLTVSLTETEDGLAGQIEYSTALYKSGTIARLAAHFTALCEAAAATPQDAIRDLDYLGADEKQTLLADFNATQAGYPTGKLLHQLFVAQVPEHAESVAVVCGDQQLTYEQLYTRSRKLALYLQSQGIGPDALVGVCMERSLDMIVSMFGILQAGGAYVPLDPNHPEDRLAYMVRDSRAAIVLTQESLVEKLSAVIPEESRLVAVDRDRKLIARSVGELRQETCPSDLAYVIYTSGSTGNPKGVAIEHHSPVTLVYWAQDVYSREELRGVLAATSICFDLSVYEIFLTLASGGTILLVQNALGLIDLASKDAVTLINTVPSAAEELVRLNAIPASVQTINLAGEPLPARLVDRLYETTSVKKVFDLYGPSEDTTYSTFTLRVKNGPQTIGRPIANTQVYIVDANDNIQPIGIPGELCIAGDGLCRGYLHRPELTEQKFVANPFQAGTRMYRTGDLARWMDDGTLQYLGRIDTQVKIRGFRIELGEIEARLNEIVKDAVVIATGQGAERQLVAFYCADETVAYEEFRAHLTKTLPDYMVPSAFVQLEAIPLNPNGKVDRRALSRIDVTVAAGAREYVAPRNETERRLAAIWSEILNLETVGIHDNFFELGGHSLLATQLVSKIRAEFGVDLPLKALFEESSVAQLAQRIDGSAQSDVPAIVPVDRTRIERLPLSFAQERLWFINQLEPESAAYNLPEAIVIRGALDVDALEAAFNRIIERHENLRTVFPTEEGRAQQRILDSVDFRLERLEARDEDEARAICQAEATTLFDLAGGPLLRGKVIRLADDRHILLLNLHHIVSDGWSAGVLMNELTAILEGRELAPLPIQYADYAVWQRQWLESGVLETQLAYWQRKLAGVPESLDLPSDFARPAVPSFAGATHTFALDAELTAALERLAEQQGVTLYMVLMAAFKALLHRYTNQEDLCVGSAIANRNHGETEALIGMFVNTLAMRTAVESNDTFDALLAKVKATCLEAYEHQDAPFEKVIDALRLQRNLSITPLFQVMLILQNAAAGMPAVERFPLASGISKFDLTFELAQTADGLTGLVRYRTALYRPETIARMAEHFAAVCRAAAAAPRARIHELDYVSAAEKETLLVAFNDTRADYPSGTCVHQLFAEQVATNPEKTAVVFGDDSLTYQELYQRSCDLASYLRAQGVRPDSLVGISMEKSLDMVVALLGILQAGGAYVPFDPDYPAERLQYMIDDAQPVVVLTQESLKGSLPRTSAPVIAIDSEWSAIAAGEYTALAGDVRPDNLAYVIYTSGSTGLPKGVMIEHESLTNYLSWITGFLDGEGVTCLPAVTNLSFDASLKQIFGPLVTGRTVVLVKGVSADPEGLLNTLAANEGTGVNCVPSLWRMLLDLMESRDDVKQSVKGILLGGEEIPRELIRRSQQAIPGLHVTNLYGPTETTANATFARRVTPDDVTIGRPVANTTIYILDAQRRPVPVGVVGEIYIGGICVARGYLNRPELTEEKFVANPFGEGRLYKSGDLGRWRADGNIEYVGRNDQQVKVRGQRIELGEIEAQLAKHPAVKEAIVIAREDEPGDKRLVAYITTFDVPVAAEELRVHLQTRVPQYMIPAAFVELAALPLTPTKKVDRKALPKPESQAFTRNEYQPPAGEVEAALAEIWQELLRVERVGRTDDFFELGGHSLSAVQLMAKINRRFARSLPLAVLFTAPTIAALAKLMSADAAAPAVVVPIRTGDAAPLFAVPGAGGNVVSLRPLAKAFETLYALQAQAFDSVEETARANVEAIRTVQPHGPYRLAGHSYGGVVAYEMARLLAEGGEEIASLTLFDSVAPAVAQRLFTNDEAAVLADACRALGLDVDLRRASHEEIVAALHERDIAIDLAQFDAFVGVYRANVRSNRSYQPRALPRAIDVTLYRATERRADLPDDYGWSALLQTPVRTVDVTANHHSILENVRIETAADALAIAIA